nr:MAG TPA: Prohead core protein protease [Caudoviricetes sp.]
MPKTLTRESVGGQPTSDLTGAKIAITIITPGQGSSGYYPPETIAAAAHLFPAGTHMYINHQTETEEWERPEGDLNKLAGALATPATINPETGALEATAEIFESHRKFLADRAHIIGVSINGTASINPDGIVEAIHSIRSVDFVTRPGRGGRIDQILEHQKEDEGEMPKPHEQQNPVEEITGTNDTLENNTPGEAVAGETAPASDENTADAAAEAVEPGPVENDGCAESARESAVSEAERLATENKALHERIAVLEGEARRTVVESIVREEFHGINAPHAVKTLTEAGAADKNLDAEAFRESVRAHAAEYPRAPYGAPGVYGIPAGGGDTVTESDIIEAMKG